MKLGFPEPIAALNRVRILETNEPLVDIRDFSPGVQVLQKVCPYLRRTVAEMLNRASDSVPHGYRFRIGSALRTIDMQRKGWDRYFTRMKAEHPDWPSSALRRATNRYFAPYDQPAPPGHTTGGAVDVILLGPNGRPADVNSPLERWEAAYTWSDRISPQAKHNRMIMVDAMLGAGFSNCRDEYWHYSWGDSAWAVRVGEQTCPYGLVDPPVAVETNYRGGSASRVDRLEEGKWLLTADSGALDVGVYWSKDKPVELAIEGIAPESTLYVSKDRKRWKFLSPASDAVTITPRYDRIYLESIP